MFGTQHFIVFIITGITFNLIPVVARNVMFRHLSPDGKSSEQFVWLHRRHREMETQLARSGASLSMRPLQSQEASIEAVSASSACHGWLESALPAKATWLADVSACHLPSWP